MKERELSLSSEELYSELLVVLRSFQFFKTYSDSDFRDITDSIPVSLRPISDLYIGDKPAEFFNLLTESVTSLIVSVCKNEPPSKDGVILLDTMEGSPFYFITPGLKMDFEMTDKIWERQAEGIIVRNKFPLMTTDFSGVSAWSEKVEILLATLNLSENKGPRMTMMIIWKLFSALTDMRELMKEMLSKACRNHLPFINEEFAAYFAQCQLDLLCDQFIAERAEFAKMHEQHPVKVTRLIDSANKEHSKILELVTKKHACKGFTLLELRWFRFAMIISDANGSPDSCSLVRAIDGVMKGAR
jgi:hypothetical protein